MISVVCDTCCCRFLAQRAPMGCPMSSCSGTLERILVPGDWVSDGQVLEVSDAPVPVGRRWVTVQTHTGGTMSTEARYLGDIR